MVSQQENKNYQISVKKEKMLQPVLMFSAVVFFFFLSHMNAALTLKAAIKANFEPFLIHMYYIHWGGTAIFMSIQKRSGSL